MTDARYASGPPPRNSITPTATQRPLPLVDLSQPDSRFVIHIPFKAPTLGTALGVAERLADFLTFIPEFDSTDTAVSLEDDQLNQHPVYCGTIIPTQGRCLYLYGHTDPCSTT
ncbi:hypothetical protein BDK92_3506 [Micromonospora pisi]|uniref:Uncharacterized protein n=1 Tax=Micromonospora pisi TaxID=589240 RepID=A0A495JKS8_9ACTN|nr:hypothetical protein [Micromonospora pisi]RKR89168.1 hypothetical protein BDK92_3506 [Micromonospora pisi]